MGNHEEEKKVRSSGIEPGSMPEVELPSFNGDDPIGLITRKKLKV